MPRFIPGRHSRLAALLVAAVLGLALAAGASADTPRGRGPTPTPTSAGRCAVLHVQLNGDRPATQTCVVPEPAGQGSAQSAQLQQGVAPVGCTFGYVYELELYQHTYYGGKRICISGSGHANLSAFSLGWLDDWDDQMSSFRTYRQYVNFYEHANAGGAKLRYATYQSRPSMPSGWDNRVSSICVFGPSFTCP